MKIKGVTDEDFINYKVPSMFIAVGTCSFKCDKESGKQICQNYPLANEPTIEISCTSLCDRYFENHISKAIVFGGLEPLDQPDELISFIKCIRTYCDDDIVIYTGYTKEELLKVKYLNSEMSLIDGLKSSFCNIVIKYGRYIPDQPSHYDPVLKVNLASDNQYAEKIS